MTAPPVAVWSGELRVGPLVLRCYELADGRRLVDAESADAFAAWLEDEHPPPVLVAAIGDAIGAWGMGGTFPASIAVPNASGGES